MEWARPYLQELGGLNLILPVHRLVSIKGYRQTKQKLDGSLGTTSALNGWYSITILLKYAHKKQGQCLEDLLFTLAHELAHLKYWQHTPEHLVLTARILFQFSMTAQRLKAGDTSKPVTRR